MRSMVFLVLGVFLLSCSHDYGEDDSQKMGKTIPNTVFDKIHQVTYQNGKQVFDVTADQAQFFDVNQKATLAKAHFKEFDSEGKVSVEGKADKVEMRLDTKDATISGNVSVYSAFL